MWMQQSMESASFAHGGNPHDRNRFGPPGSSHSLGFGNSGSSGAYMGGGSSNSANNADWKSKILESGQWLGGKVIEYGGKLARGGAHDSIPDHSLHPRNDGRANWMADIRNSSSSFNGNQSYAGGGGAYQNDFVTERPKMYSDSAPSSSTNSYSAPAPLRDRTNSDKDARRGSSKKKASSHSKSSKKKHSKRRAASDSEDSSDADSHSDSDDASSASDSGDDRRRNKSSSKGGKKNKSKHHKRKDSLSESSDDEDSLEAKPKAKKNVSSVSKPEKAPADYSFSFDPAKLPPPPVEESSSKKSKHDSKKKKDKSRGRKHSVESSESELSDKENQRVKKVSLKSKTSSKKTATNHTTVDLLGVDLDATPVQPVASAFAPLSHQPDIFAPTVDPLQDLAGLNFTASYQQPPPPAPVAFGLTPQQPHQQETAKEPTLDTRVVKKLLPDNDIVDLDSLASVKKTTTANGVPVEKKTLNELQRAHASSQQQQQQQQQQAMMMAMQQQQAMMMHQQQQQQHAMGMNPAMHMAQMAQMNSMMHQMHIQGQPMQQQQQQQAMYAAAMYPAQSYAANQQPNNSHHFPYTQQHPRMAT